MPVQPALAPGAFSLLRQPAVHYASSFGAVLAAIVRDGGHRRILPVVTPSLLAHPRVSDALVELGGTALPSFSGTKPHTPFPSVLALVREIEHTTPDLVVVVGGGSAIDTAKVATLAAGTGTVDRNALLSLRSTSGAQGEMLSSPATRTIPLVAVPTTLSAAEFGIIAGGTDLETGIKHLFRSASLAPDTVIYDPSLAVDTPLDLWLSTGIRALDHGVETVLSKDANPFMDPLALEGLALLGQGLARANADPQSIEARHMGQLGAWLCGCAIGRVRYGASHGLGHQLGAVAGVPHGMTSCVLLPAVLAYNESVSRDRQARISAALGRPGDCAADVVREFIASLGLPTRMSLLQVDRASLPRVAETALGNAFVKANLKPVTSAADILTILEAAY